MKVLIVDDTTFIRMTLRQLLEKNGHTIVGEAADGLEAVKRYKRLLPDFVVMDISMPIMNGIEAVKHIRSFDPNAQIIICSLQGQRSNVMEAIKVGANSFIIKPIDESKLLVEISKLDPNKKRPLKEKVEEKVILTPAQAIAKNLMAATKSKESIENSYGEGIKAGYLEARREIATNMYRLGLDIEIISKCVEISKEEVENFAKLYSL